MPLVGYICIYDHLLDGFYHFLIFMKLRNDFYMEFVLQFRGPDLQLILDTPSWLSDPLKLFEVDQNKHFVVNTVRVFTANRLHEHTYKLE